MPAIRPELHTSLVYRMLNDILYERSYLFYFLGKIDKWNSDDTPPTDIANTPLEDLAIRDNILYIQRVAPSETSLVVPTFAWSSGAVFTQWDNTQEMKGKNFYCVTDEFNVYKCLNNNSGAESTVKPTGSDLFPFTTSDGYLWKYMYNIPVFKRNKFFSDTFADPYTPVQQALTDSFFNRGGVEQVVINDSGSGYEDSQETSISVSTLTTTGAGATARVASIGLYGDITSIQIINPGANYTRGAFVTISDSVGGSGAKIEPIFTNGQLTSFNIENAGYGYSIGDTVNINVGGAVLIPIVSRETGSIIDVYIENAGAGYNSAPQLQVNQINGGAGVGKFGNSSAIVKAVIFDGKIANISIEDPGINYPANTSTTLVVYGDGLGARFTPVVFNGRIIRVVVDNPGNNYSYMQIAVIGQGQGAILTPVLTRSDFESDQAIVEQVAIPGAIYAIEITNPGTGYSNNTTVTIIGDGIEATAHPVIESGSITKIIMDSYGRDYTNAKIVFNDPSRIEPNQFVDAEAYAILPPVGGHGKNAPIELFAETICIFTLLRNEIELVLLNQDYRQYGLIKDVTNLFDSTKISTLSQTITFKIKLNNTLNLLPDEVLINNNKKYRVVKVSDNDVELQQLSSIYKQPSGMFYKENNINATYSIISIDSVPKVNKYSGQLLYTTNEPSFTSTDKQSIAIRTYIRL